MRNFVCLFLTYNGTIAMEPISMKFVTYTVRSGLSCRLFTPVYITRAKPCGQILVIYELNKEINGKVLVLIATNNTNLCKYNLCVSIYTIFYPRNHYYSHLPFILSYLDKFMLRVVFQSKQIM